MAGAIVFSNNKPEIGLAVAEVSRKMGTSEATYHNWKKSTVDWELPNYNGQQNLVRVNQNSFK